MVHWILDNLTWRWRCPSEIDAIARHWIENSIPIEYRIFDFDAVDDRDPWFAWRRQINHTYGIATYYEHPNGIPGQRGWNKKLWKTVGNVDPERLVETIFDRVIELLREAADETVDIATYAIRPHD